MDNFAKLRKVYDLSSLPIMAKEIERKFLVENANFKELSSQRYEIMQGYLSRRIDATVRVRVRDDKAFLTVKGRNHGVVRDEWEYEIPVEEAREMLERCAEGSVLDKTRYIVPFGGYVWEVDEFHGIHEGLVVAEVELSSSDADFPIPPFVGREVTGDIHYYNSNL